MLRSKGSFHARLLIFSAYLLAFLGSLAVAGRTTQAPSSVTLTLLSTTDIHGHVEPWDYYTNRPANLGLAKVATLVKQVRAESPQALLLDCGDTIQGTPLAYYFARKDATKPNPTIAGFNAMRYDAMAVGNHDFNFGLDTLWKAKRESKFPWLAANIKQSYTNERQQFAPYIVKAVQGVRVGIVAFVTPGIPRWEIPAHYRGYEFEPIVEAAKKVIPEVRAKSDLVVVIMHSGLDRDPKTGALENEEHIAGENAAWELAEGVPGIDVIFYGHTHGEIPELWLKGVLLAQAKNWGESLARADVTLKKDAAGRWRVLSKHSWTIPVTEATPADPEIMKLAEPYQEAVQKYLDTPIATSAKALQGTYSRYEDDPLVDLIHKVQLEAGRADVSMATLFFPGVQIPAGPVTVREAAALYIYENTLYTVEMTGAQLKDALEHAASFFPAWPFQPGKELSLPGYNADSAEGVSYVIDLRKPVGSRIQELKFHGKPLEAAQRLRVAINNYRYTGGGGYSVYRGLPILYRSGEEIRELLIEYLERTKRIPSEPDGNWRVEPPEALAAIKRAAAEDSRAGSR